MLTKTFASWPILLLLVVGFDSTYAQKNVIEINYYMNMAFGLKEDFREFQDGLSGVPATDFLDKNGNKVFTGIGKIKEIGYYRGFNSKWAVGLRVSNGYFRRSLGYITFKNDPNEDPVNAGNFMSMINEIAGTELGCRYAWRNLHDKIIFILNSSIGVSVWYDYYFEGGRVSLQSSMPSLNIINPDRGFSIGKIKQSLKFNDYRYTASIEPTIDVKLYKFIYSKIGIQYKLLFRSQFRYTRNDGSIIHDTWHDFVDPIHLLSFSVGLYAKF